MSMNAIDTRPSPLSDTDELRSELNSVRTELDRLRQDYDQHLLFGTAGSILATAIFLGLIAFLIVT